MWTLILYIGAAAILGQTPNGGPTSTDFPTETACNTAYAKIQASFGEERPFDQRFQAQVDNGLAYSRLWTVKGVCVPK